MAEQLFDEQTSRKPAIIAVVIVIVLAAGGWYFWHSHNMSEAQSPVIPTPAAPEASSNARIEHPVPAGDAAKGALPDLNDSDKPIAAALGEAVGTAAVTAYLVPESVIRHIVVTVDNLARQKISVERRPIVPAPGVFIARGDEIHSTLDAQNFRRYAPLIEALRKADMTKLAAVYLRFYPLFQKSYQDLGYPTEYFNDRLVKVIDDMLATPQVAGPIDLTRPNVMYVFADQSLESRSAGQKLLIRMGPDNAAVVKAKLTELRAIVTAVPPKH